uniref:3-beta hydroxysteroid dehydrogenase/isomerase domain-containing protein n=1 Tax=Globodera rostochiensis TaxID=31243 RepID=A0A914HAJ7_GLORO
MQIKHKICETHSDSLKSANVHLDRDVLHDGDGAGRRRMCILGGGGYLGQLLALSLQREGHFVVLFDLHFPSFGHICVDSRSCLKITGSITDATELRKALAGCDACFHLAGYGMSGGPSLDREKCFLVNVEGTRRVLEECRRAGIGRVVFTSTVLVIFDGSELDMADEEGTPYIRTFGSNAYAESKCVAEKMVLMANSQCLATCALRLRGIYGPGELRTVKRTADLCMRGVVKCSFGKTPRVLTQYSGADNTVQALMLSEKSLREGSNSRAAGKAYHIMDGGPPVDSFRFWYPLIAGIGCPLPSIRISYNFAYALGVMFELVYKMVGWEPLFTRHEVALMGVPNTYSIERARHDLAYSPTPASDQLARTIEFLRLQLDADRETASSSGSYSAKNGGSGGQWLRDRKWLFLAYFVDEAEKALFPSKWSLVLTALLGIFIAMAFLISALPANRPDAF